MLASAARYLAYNPWLGYQIPSLSTPRACSGKADPYTVDGWVMGVQAADPSRPLGLAYLSPISTRLGLLQPCLPCLASGSWVQGTMQAFLRIKRGGADPLCCWAMG
ncbi:hypothetical protein DSO57_1014504 [Entomophthora muscae]|uniref:Uncharacterized protein n=1 Tax=Entomophthora muscae TaxID=34485 RepID=A0ACC2SIH1_9FUNG|nr:hypothetical protein DSO57_1014504 [Entomophthora muscae]